MHTGLSNEMPLVAFGSHRERRIFAEEYANTISGPRYAHGGPHVRSLPSFRDGEFSIGHELLVS